MTLSPSKEDSYSHIQLKPLDKYNPWVKSFAFVLGISYSSNTIPLKSPSTFKGEPAVIFSEEEVVALAEPLRFALF